MHGIRTALYPLWEFAVLKATNQRTVAIRTIVDIQEVIVGFNVETRDRLRKGTRGRGKKQTGRTGSQRVNTAIFRNEFPSETWLFTELLLGFRLQENMCRKSPKADFLSIFRTLNGGC